MLCSMSRAHVWHLSKSPQGRLELGDDSGTGDSCSRKTKQN